MATTDPIKVVIDARRTISPQVVKSPSTTTGGSTTTLSYNIDGGHAATIYGGMDPITGGTA